MTAKDVLKAILATHPSTETALRKRYHLPQLYRAKLLAKRRESPPYPLAEYSTDDGGATNAEIERLARELGVYVDEYMHGSLYNPALHPALANIPAERASDERYQFVANNLDASAGRVLDIGCHIGAYFASRFDEAGFDAVALDENAAHAHFSKRMTTLRNPDVRVVWDSLFTWEGRTGPFDIVLGFNVFHHMLKERRLFERLKRWFRTVQVEEMFVQVPDQETPLWNGVVDWLTGEEWTDLILSESELDDVRCLGHPLDHRPMYHFTKHD